MKVYLDNAATTPLDRDVLDAMLPFLKEHHGNPSSIHNHGRYVKSAIERSRKKVAEFINASPSEIFFTSGGTEANNLAIQRTIEDYKVKYAITSPIEHHAVIHPLEYLQRKGVITLHLLETDDKGNINLHHLKELLQKYPDSFVSLMHGNNEIGNLTDIEEIGNICEYYNAFYHSDTVQTIGHYPVDVRKIKAHYIIGSAHKFHGPKGVGLLYLKKGQKMNPLLYGGAQERNMRGGTENLHGIIGMAKALEVAYRYFDEHQQHIESLKNKMIDVLQEKVPDVQFNGESANLDQSLYTVLNVSLPPAENNDMLLFNLDLHRISASGGSACNSGSNLGSHVLQALSTESNRGSVRFSFSKYNTLEEIQYVADTLRAMYAPVKA